MLLNEVQRQSAQLHEEVQLRQEENPNLEKRNRKLEDRLAALEVLISSQTSLPQAR